MLELRVSSCTSLREKHVIVLLMTGIRSGTLCWKILLLLSNQMFQKIAFKRRFHSVRCQASRVKSQTIQISINDHKNICNSQLCPKENHIHPAKLQCRKRWFGVSIGQWQMMLVLVAHWLQPRFARLLKVSILLSQDSHQKRIILRGQLEPRKMGLKGQRMSPSERKQ